MRFAGHVLRAIDPAAAAGFYRRVFEGERLGGEIAVEPLPGPARARGAPSHWLGRLAVADVTAAVERVRAAGGLTLGPVSEARAVCRDPGGAVFGLDAAPVARGPFDWAALHTDDARRATAFYGALTPADVGDPVALPGVGPVWPLRSAGAVLETAVLETVGRLPGVHPHWLFHAPVDDLDAALARVEAEGGRVIGAPTTALDGLRVAACEDPEGAAFGLGRRDAAT
ncbi:MAG: VOC family protein [Myxococcota bacterium]|nr:VOC family protein [Myxococcota bacterium]